MRWMIYRKDIGKQINVVLLQATIFLVFYYFFGMFGSWWLATMAKGLSLLFVVYLLVYAILLTKKWIDKNYK